jgi:hypothetical protein
MDPELAFVLPLELGLIGRPLGLEEIAISIPSSAVTTKTEHDTNHWRCENTVTKIMAGVDVSFAVKACDERIAAVTAAGGDTTSLVAQRAALVASGALIRGVLYNNNIGIKLMEQCQAYIQWAAMRDQDSSIGSLLDRPFNLNLTWNDVAQNLYNVQRWTNHKMLVYSDLSDTEVAKLPEDLIEIMMIRGSVAANNMFTYTATVSEDTITACTFSLRNYTGTVLKASVTAEEVANVLALEEIPFAQSGGDNITLDQLYAWLFGSTSRAGATTRQTYVTTGRAKSDASPFHFEKAALLSGAGYPDLDPLSELEKEKLIMLCKGIVPWGGVEACFTLGLTLCYDPEDAGEEV